MKVLVLAIGDRLLASTCEQILKLAGHVVLPIETPSELELFEQATWDALCVDESGIGRLAMQTMAFEDDRRRPVIGLGFKDAPVANFLPLPLVPLDLIQAIEKFDGEEPREALTSALGLDMAKRIASFQDKQIGLTRTEARLLEILLKNRFQEMSPRSLLVSVWGFQDEGRSSNVLVRAHIRNLRAKLTNIGLPDAIRSRRGRGYALEL